MRLKTAAFTIFAVGFLLAGLLMSALPPRQAQASGETWTVNCTSSLRVEDCTVVGEGGALHGKNTFVYNGGNNRFVGSVRYAANPDCYLRQDLVIDNKDIIHDAVKTGDGARLLGPTQDNGGTCTDGKLWLKVGDGKVHVEDGGDTYIAIKLTAGEHAPDNDCTSQGADKNTTIDCNPAPTDDGQDSEGPEIICELSIINPMTWLICPIVAAAQGAVQTLDNAIDTLMNINTDKNSAFDTSGATGKAYHTAWSSFRALGSGIIIIGGLLMIIAQAAGLEIFDAYTVRKTLPRLLIAAIFITLSWYVVGFFIQLSNDVGNSVRAVIYQPFHDIGDGTIRLGQSGSLVAGIVGGIGITALGLLGMGTFALGALIAVFVGFVILMIRKLIILMLIITAPLAIACYVLPNTQRVFTFWRDTLVSMLVVFPIISAFIAVGRVFAIVAYTQPGNGTAFDPNPTGIAHGFAVLAYHLGFAQSTGSPGILPTCEAFFAYFAPYLLMKQAFDLAGGLISTVKNGVSNASGGMQAGLRNYRGNRRKLKGERRAMNRAAWAAGNRFKGNSKVAGWLNRTGRNVANVRNAGVVPHKMRSRMQAAGATHEASELAEYMDKNADFKAIAGNDDYLQATMKSMGGGEKESDWRSYLSREGYSGRALEQGVAQIRAAKRGVSNEVFAKAAVMANASTGTGWKEGGFAAMAQSINEATHGDTHLANNMLAQMRGSAMQAGRVDLGGAGFGTSSGVMEGLRTGSMNAEQANRQIAKNVLFTKDGASLVARARGDAVKNLAPYALEGLQDSHAEFTRAQQGGNAAEIAAAERALAQQYAAMDNVHTSLAHSSPENAQIFADAVLRERATEGSGTVMEEISRYQANPGTIGGQAFLETTKTYGGSEAAARGGTPPEPDGG